VNVRIRVGSLTVGAGEHAGEVYRSTERQDVVSLEYRHAIDTLWRAGREILKSGTFNVKTVRTAVLAILRDLVEEKDMCARLAAIKSFDDYTFNHSVNVSLISMLIGAQLGLASADLETLGTAAMLHDIGKITIRPETLNKQDALTEEEWAEIRAHPVRGAQMIIEQGEADDIAVTAAFEHHARYDGQGYPQLMPGKRQHPFSRIIAIADVYDALSSPRTYRRQLSPDKAVRYVLEGQNTHFDPLLVKVFFAVTGFYPVGTTVQLNTGEIGIVHGTNDGHPLRPLVRLLRDAGGEPTPPQLVNLAQVDQTELWVDKTIPTTYGKDGVPVGVA